MEFFEVIGISVTSYPARYNQPAVERIIFHCIRPAGNPDERGQICEILSLDKALFQKSLPDIGARVFPVRDRSGKCVDLIVQE